MIMGSSKGSSKPDARWEITDETGDARRYLLAKQVTPIFAAGTLAASALVLFGEGGLRLFGWTQLAILGLGLIFTLIGRRTIRKRLDSGRGLLPGDPFRKEGISPEERSPSE